MSYFIYIFLRHLKWKQYCARVFEQKRIWWLFQEKIIYLDLFLATILVDCYYSLFKFFKKVN